MQKLFAALLVFLATLSPLSPALADRGVSSGAITTITGTTLHSAPTLKQQILKTRAGHTLKI